MISAIVLAKNEADKLDCCLKSLSWCREIIVIDDFSQDKTRLIAKKHRARVFKHRLANDFSQQRNFGLEKAKFNWILFLDADEQVSPALKKEISLLLKNPSKLNQYAGFKIKRKDKFLDIYAYWFFSNYENFNAKKIIEKWSKFFKKLYTPILEEF